MEECPNCRYLLINKPGLPEFFCQNCKLVFKRDPNGGGLSPEEKGTPLTPSPSPTSPVSNVEILRRPNGLQFTIPWKGCSLFFMVPFTFIWNFGVIGMIIDIISKGHFGPLLFVGGIHGTAGLVMIYSCLCLFFNKTVVRVARGKLEITHGPYKTFSASHFLDTADLEQFFVEKKIHQTKNGTTTSYELWVKRVSGKDIQLLKGYSSREEVELLEREIEQFLGIEDKPVDNRIED